MSTRDGLWGALERRRSSAFLLGGVLLTVDAAIVAAVILTGNDRYLFIGQAVVGAGWTAALVGLLGIYPGVADRSRWLARAGGVFAAVGIVTFAVMTLSVLAYATDLVAGEYEAIAASFIPGVLLGSVLGFVAMSAATLRSGFRSRSFGLLLLLPAALVLTNILRFAAGNESVGVTLGIVIGDAAAMLAIGYVLRSG